MTRRIGLHRMVIYNTKAIISTVEMFGAFETMVLLEDGDELECHISATEQEARKLHNSLVNKYNDKIYEGSIAKLLGEVNVGQFVKTVVAC